MDGKIDRIHALVPELVSSLVGKEKQDEPEMPSMWTD